MVVTFVSTSTSSLISPVDVSILTSLISPFTSFDAASRSEKALRSAVKRTLCAQPASFPQSFRKRFPTASYVALVNDLWDPFPNL